MAGFIYIWTNTINGKKYLGSHRGDVNDGYTGSGSLFKKAIAKYGIDAFDREILEHVEDDAMLLEREQHYLDTYDAANSESFYNLKAIAGGGFDYINNLPGRKERISKYRIEYLKNNPHPRGMLGKKHTKESMDKTRAGWKAWAKENRMRPVIKFSIDGDYIEEYESISAAARGVNGRPSNIKYTIEGKHKHAYGYKWQYK